MNKYCGKIGYAVQTESKPGVYTDDITERTVYGDIEKNTRMLENSGNVNDNININVILSIVADAFAMQNFHRIKYAEYCGVKWKVRTAEVRHPRLLLTLGDEYNG